MNLYLSAEQAATQIARVIRSTDETEIPKAFKLLFEQDPNLARIISQSVANFEGTQAAKPQSNATQVEYIDDYLDRLRGEETDFYK